MLDGKLVLFTTLLLYSVNSWSQSIISFDAGVINSKLRISNLDQVHPSDINNYYVSAGFGYRFSEAFEFKTDIMYSTKGYDMRFGEDQLDFEIYNFDYLSLAPHIAYRPLNFLSLIGGISVSQKLRERSRQAGFIVGDWEKTNTIKNIDLNLNIGARFHYDFFYFKLLFEHGVKDINKLLYSDENGMPIPNVMFKNSSIQLGFGLYLWG